MPPSESGLYSQTARKNLTFHDYSYEIGSNENVIDRIDDYTVQIEIPAAL